MPIPWPTGAPVSGGMPPPACIAPSWRISKPIVRCVCTTPFGSAVVPDVYATSASADGSTRGHVHRRRQRAS